MLDLHTITKNLILDEELLGAPGRFRADNHFCFIFMALIGVYMNTVKFGSHWRPLTAPTGTSKFYTSDSLVID